MGCDGRPAQIVGHMFISAGLHTPTHIILLMHAMINNTRAPRFTGMIPSADAYQTGRGKWPVMILTTTPTVRTRSSQGIISCNEKCVSMSGNSCTYLKCTSLDGVALLWQVCAPFFKASLLSPFQACSCRPLPLVCLNLREWQMLSGKAVGLTQYFGKGLPGEVSACRATLSRMARCLAIISCCLLRC